MPLRYPGQYFDAEARVAYNYFRDYEQGTGRYTQADPIGLGGGWNRFVYGDSRPMSRIDPLGLDDYPIFPQAYLDRQLVSADYRSRTSAYRRSPRTHLGEMRIDVWTIAVGAQAR